MADYLSLTTRHLPVNQVCMIIEIMPIIQNMIL